MHSYLIVTAIAILSSLLSPASTLAQNAPTTGFFLGLDATVQRYPVGVAVGGIGRQTAALRPLQLIIGYTFTNQLGLQTGVAWHTGANQSRRRRSTNAAGRVVERVEEGARSVSVPLLLRYALLPPQQRWNLHLLSGFMLVATSQRVTEQDATTNQITEYKGGRTLALLTLGGGLTYRLKGPLQATADAWLSRSPETGIDFGSGGLALGLRCQF